MSSDSDAKSPPGTLIVEVPHWTAVVKVLDSYSRPAAQLTTAVEEGSSARVTVQLNPGIYKVDVSLGLTRESEWAPVRSGKLTVIPVSRWSALRLPSDETSTGAPGDDAGARMRLAQQHSLEPTWTAPPGGPSRLFVFVHTPDPSKYPNFAQGLSLADASGRTMTELNRASQGDASKGWTTFVADLAAGSCFLRRNGPGRFTYWLPLYLSEGWETQVLMVGGRGPSLRSVTTYMSRRGTGFHHDPEIAAATEAILVALVHERGMGAVLGSQRLHRILRGENPNPWLGVLAAYALTAIEREARDENRDPSAVPYYDKGLKDEILQFLTNTIRDHPDVRALLLDEHAAAAAPFPTPPMLRMALRRVQQHATKFAGTVPLGSVTDRMLDRQVASSAWCVWRVPAVTETLESMDDPGAARRASGAVRTRQGIASATLRSNFPPSAPIYGGRKESNATGSSPSLANVLKDLFLIRAAQSMLREPVEALKESIEVNPTAELHKLLEGVNAEGLSADGGIPLARAERALQNLRSVADKGAGRGRVGRTTRAAIDYALRRSERGRNRTGAQPDPSNAPRVTIEESVSVLRGAAAQLRKAEPSPEAELTTERADALAERLERIARALIRCSDVVVITDSDNQFLYANGAFNTLMTIADPRVPEGPTKAWTEHVSSLPLGPSINVRLPGSTEAAWTVHRAAVTRAGELGVVAYVNLAEDRGGKPVAFEMLAAVSKRMADVTLHSSFIQYASRKRRAESMRRLETIADDLEKVLAI